MQGRVCGRHDGTTGEDLDGHVETKEKQRSDRPVIPQEAGDPDEVDQLAGTASRHNKVVNLIKNQMAPRGRSRAFG
jgi:hypothetical protein